MGARPLQMVPKQRFVYKAAAACDSVTKRENRPAMPTISSPVSDPSATMIMDDGCFA